MTTIIPDHPAPFSASLLPIFARILDAHRPRRREALRVLDPFAGIGRVHQLQKLCERPTVTLGVELLPRWAAAHPMTYVGDSTQLPQDWARYFDAVVTSPCYGNRMADSHEARDVCKTCKGSGLLGVDRGDGYVDEDPTHRVAIDFALKCEKCKGSGLSHRRTYRHYHGAEGWVEENNAGAMQWGDEYRSLHELVWAEAWRVLKRGGLLVLNIKDHQRGGVWQRVPAWHNRTLRGLGFVGVETWKVPARGYRMGANGHRHQDEAKADEAMRADAELAYVFRKP